MLLSKLFKNFPKIKNLRIKIPKILKFNLQNPVVTTDASMTTVDEMSTVYPQAIQGWKKVDGWFAEYPPSLGMNRFI